MLFFAVSYPLSLFNVVTVLTCTVAYSNEIILERTKTKRFFLNFINCFSNMRELFANIHLPYMIMFVCLSVFVKTRRFV